MLQIRLSPKHLEVRGVLQIKIPRRSFLFRILNNRFLLCLSVCLPPKFSFFLEREKMSLTCVKMSEEVWLTCLTHALSTETEEIMGLLLGDIEVRSFLPIFQFFWVMYMFLCVCCAQEFKLLGGFGICVTWVVF